MDTLLTLNMQILDVVGFFGRKSIRLGVHAVWAFMGDRVFFNLYDLSVASG